MGCSSCKNKEKDILSVFKSGDSNIEVNTSEKDLGFRIFNFSIRLVLFFIGVLLSPLMLIFVIYLLFKIMVLNNGSVNLTPTLLSIAKTLGIGKRKSIEEYPEDYEDLDVNNPDDYILDEIVDKVK